MTFLKRAPKVKGTTAVGLGAQGFSLARVSRDGDGVPALERCEYHECDEQVLARTLAETVREHGLRGSNCVCVLAPGTYAVRQIERPAVADGELVDVARWAVSDLVDFDVSEAVIDTFEILGSSSRDRPARIYAVAAPRTHVDAAALLIRRAGLSLVAIYIVELALRNVAALLSEDEDGVALMSLGLDPGLLGLTRQGSLYLARSFEVDAEMLEKLAGYNVAELKLEETEDAGSMLEGFLLEVQRSLDYVEHQLGQPRTPNLVIAPLPFPTEGLCIYLAQNLNIEVTSLDLNQRISSPNKVALAD